MINTVCHFTKLACLHFNYNMSYIYGIIVIIISYEYLLFTYCAPGHYPKVLCTYPSNPHNLWKTLCLTYEEIEAPRDCAHSWTTSECQNQDLNLRSLLFYSSHLRPLLVLMASLCILETGLSLSGQIRKITPNGAASQGLTPSLPFGLVSAQRTECTAVCGSFHSTPHYLSLLLQISGNFHMHGFIWFWLQPY